jgi:hypothetical protein
VKGIDGSGQGFEVEEKWVKVERKSCNGEVCFIKRMLWVCDALGKLCNQREITAISRPPTLKTSRTNTLPGCIAGP